MAEDDDDASKTEDPTGKKLGDAREKGNVPQSQEAKI
jgi:flagellar biosynthetic protein FlhB